MSSTNIPADKLQPSSSGAVQRSSPQPIKFHNREVVTYNVIWSAFKKQYSLMFKTDYDAAVGALCAALQSKGFTLIIENEIFESVIEIGNLHWMTANPDYEFDIDFACNGKRFKLLCKRMRNALIGTRVFSLHKNTKGFFGQQVGLALSRNVYAIDDYTKFAISFINTFVIEIEAILNETEEDDILQNPVDEGRRL